MRRHGFLVILLAGTTAGGAWLLNQNTSLDASEESAKPFREAFGGVTDSPEPVEDEEGIRLNFFESSWDRVLRNVAEQGKLTLVMDKVPHGRFARRDRKRYEAESAVRILNAELEPQGFRLVTQGQFLIVLKLDEARTKYARPALTEWSNSAYPKTPGQTSTLFGQRAAATPFQQSSARAGDGSPRVSWASQQASQNEGDSQLPPSPTASPFGGFVTPKPASKPSETTANRQDDGPVEVKSVAVASAKAADVARSIYLVFESRSKLVKQGLQGLPTFVVNDAPSTENGEEPTALFRIGIDQTNNALLVEATAKRTKHLTRLIDELDKPQIAANETVRLLPNKGVTDVTAKGLNEQIHRLVALQSQAEQQSEGDPAVAANPVDPTQDGSSLNLRGDVNVQAMQELGILILKGNEGDVEKVSRIIQQLEEMSVGSLPDIHLLMLEHVNSEAMSELLTEVYTELSELRNRGTNNRKVASFLPVVKPNAILILAPKIDLESILDLADRLDERVDPESEFKAFSLKNAIASEVATSVTTFFDERGGLGTRVRIVADARTNSVIVQGRANDLEEIAKLVEKFDRDEPGAVHRVEIVELKHATATELADIISTAIQSASNPPRQSTQGGGGFGGGNQTNQDLQGSKSVALEFLTATGNGRELIRSGILVDVRVSADPRLNSLVISAPEASMPLLLALARQLDLPPTAIAEIKVFALRNADAVQSVELLTSLFENQNQADQLGIQIAGAEDAASSLIPIQFSADTRTNTVLAVGSAESLSVVEAILLRLDTTESRQRTTTVVPMRNVAASVVADAVNAFLAEKQALQDTDLISNIERIRQEVIVAADDNSNSLIVSASPEYFSQISQIITELDANPPQVIIQALIVEVQLENTDEFGIELGFQDPTLFSRSILSSVADIVTTTTTNTLQNGTQTTTTNIESRNETPGFNFNNTTSALGNNSGRTDNSLLASQGISNFSLGRQNSDLGFGGFVFSAQSDAVSVLVRALAARRTVQVLSRPQIRTTHNNTARIQVGQQVPIVDGVTTTDNFVTPNITQQDIGIILEVTPRVTADNTIYMDVYAEKSSLSGGGVPVYTDVTTGNVVESVIIDSAIADTAVAVPNGQTIVIGGMITKSDETLERKVPWLGDLPIVGSAFRYDSTTTARRELLIFLTPRIIYGDADSELIKQVESERMHFIESEAEALHGPLFSVPQSDLDQYMGEPMPPMMPGTAIPLEGYSIPQSPDIFLPPQTRASGKSNLQGRELNVAAKSVGNNPVFGTGDQGPEIIPTSGTNTKGKVETASATSSGDGAGNKSKTDDSGAAAWARRFMRSKNSE